MYCVKYVQELILISIRFERPLEIVGNYTRTCHTL